MRTFKILLIIVASVAFTKLFLVKPTDKFFDAIGNRVVMNVEKLPERTEKEHQSEAEAVLVLAAGLFVLRWVILIGMTTAIFIFVMSFLDDDVEEC